MPDIFGNPTISDIGYQALAGAQTVLPQAQAGLLPFTTAQTVLPQAQAGLLPFTTGDLGASPLTQAAIAAFKQNALPVIQNQFTLQGLGHSPALGVAVGDALASAMPAFIQADLSNRLAASQALQQQGLSQQQMAMAASQALQQQGLSQQQTAGQFLGQGEQLGQSASKLIADIGNQEALRQLQAAQVAGQLLLGYGVPAAQLEQKQLESALAGFSGAGQLERGVVSEQMENEYMDFLRRQGLAEQATTGLFGGSVLPPTLQQQSKTTTDGK